jgi:hypothetical protein
MAPNLRKKERINYEQLNKLNLDLRKLRERNKNRNSSSSQLYSVTVSAPFIRDKISFVKVHYIGYDSSFDEEKPLSEIVILKDSKWTIVF